jgi:hypothetical protein
VHESDLGLSLHDPDRAEIECQVIAQGKLQLLAPTAGCNPGKSTFPCRIWPARQWSASKGMTRSARRWKTNCRHCARHL